MATDVEVERALAAVSATLNDQRPDSFERERVQQIVTEALGGEPRLEVDEGGGVHDDEGTRVGIIRRTDDGGWLVERQNPEAARSDVPVPKPARRSALRKLLTRVQAKS